ncbi:MAG: efflux RND transporter periplasmic adaptor subunit [Gammaproteobacteria bacterium]|nr:efflux RND transporter periplasmic adaptor subunit [Gammaproteobacteria bacterium]
MPESRLAVSCALLMAASLSFAQQMPAPVVQVYARNELQITAGVAGRLLMVAEPGTVVRKGDYVARIDKRSLGLQRAEQEALLERAKINVRQLESQLRRQKELASSSLVSEFELEQTEANRDLAVSDANIIEVRIRQIDDLLQRADVRAPFSGVVIDRSRRSGEEVARGEILGHLTDIEHLEVRAFVPLKHLPRTAAGQAIDVFATDAAYTGSIRSLVPTGDVRSQTFEARIDLPSDATRDWTVGQLVSVAIPIRARELRQNGSFVFRINAENKAEQIKVEIDDSAGELVAVRGNLTEGDRVAIRGAENLSEGADVRILVSESMSSGAVDTAL